MLLDPVSRTTGIFKKKFSVLKRKTETEYQREPGKVFFIGLLSTSDVELTVQWRNTSRLRS